MILSNGFIFDIPEYLRPVYRISPFRTDDVSKNHILFNTDNIKFKTYLNDRFSEKKFIVTQNGREAIGRALEVLNINKDDVVTIFTTTNSFYISGCVTKEIEKYCKWSRKIEKNTKVILVNHEFGYCSQEMEYYKSLGFPIIEDFAHSFASNSVKTDAGLYGDFLVFSLSKFFPIQVGGILVYNKTYKDINERIIYDSYIQNVVSKYIDEINVIKTKRIENYNHYVELFAKIGIKPYFKLTENDCPGVFLFKVSENINLNVMKSFIYSNGIESSVFYGESAYFIPCHQNLKKQDIEYIFEAIKYFLGKQNDKS